MELSDLARTLRRQWLAGLVAFVLVLVAGAAAALLPKSQYTASARILVTPEGASAFNSQVLGVMVANLSARTEGQTFASPVVASLPSALQSRPVSISVTGDPVSSVMSITAKSVDREAVAPWANAFADALLKSGPGTNLVQLETLDAAHPPSKPSSPARKPILFGAAILGLLAAFLAAVVANSLRGRLDGAERIHRRFGTAVLGEIPARRGRALPRPMDVFGVDSSPEIVDSFQALRLNVETALEAANYSSIALMSSTDDEGRSFLAANLAWVLASGGNHVTLIDADLRDPSLHHYLDQPMGDGFADAGSGPIDRLVLPVGGASLGFVRAGVAAQHPADVVNANLPRLLRALSGDRRFVVIDAPPLRVVETGIIASMVDAVILVVDARRRDLLDVERALSELRQKGAVVLGVVITRSRTHRGRRAGTYYAIRPRALPETYDRVALADHITALRREVAQWLDSAPVTTSIDDGGGDGGAGGAAPAREARAGRRIRPLSSRASEVRAPSTLSAEGGAPKDGDVEAPTSRVQPS